jgi:iron complex transport system substrate-binding protein
VRCYLIEILIHTMRRLDDVQAASVGQDISAFLTAYVAEHYMEPLTLQELATRLNYSLPYVSKRFKEDTGISFVHYLQNYRVMQGCRLLSSSRRTLAEITEMVGYRDVKFFSALVKRMTGLSPADFRRQYKK